MLEVCQFKYLLKDMKGQMRLFIDYFSDDFDDLTLKYLIIVNETLDEELELGSFFFIDDRRQQVIDEILKARLIENIKFRVIIR